MIMRKFILFLATSSIFLTLPVISTEREVDLTNEELYQLQYPSKYSGFHNKIPSNPNVFEKTTTYKDEELTETKGSLTPNQEITILAFKVNNQMQPVFQLSDQSYVLASQELIFDDIPLEHAYEATEFWLKPRFSVYTSPIGNRSKKVSSQLAAYSKIEATEIMTTPRGKFAKTKEGWISLDNLAEQDNRMEKVQAMLTAKYNTNAYSIYVQQLETGKMAGINQNKTMYSASVAKLPILYYVQLQLDQGKIQLKDSLKYVNSVNDFRSSYVASGSGTIPKTANNKDYSVDELIKATAKNSDNVASNILSYYVTHQFDDDYYTTIDRLTNQRWDMTNREASAQMAGQVMAALYKQNPSGTVLESLTETAFDSTRISKNIEIKVAHKIGDAYDFRHDVALVYSDSPFVISIFTDNSSYDKISNIADDVYAILK